MIITVMYQSLSMRMHSESVNQYWTRGSNRRWSDTIAYHRMSQGRTCEGWCSRWTESGQYWRTKP